MSDPKDRLAESCYDYTELYKTDITHPQTVPKHLLKSFIQNAAEILLDEYGSKVDMEEIYRILQERKVE